MAIKFGDVEGKAKKDSSYKYKDGDNVLRLVGDVLPRYLYWIKGKNNKDIPVECLSFDREKEKFTNVETDWVRHFFPELKCSWAYAVQAIDSEGKLIVVDLKKKLFEQIKTAAEDLGDPTDPVTGWDVNFKRVKTGPLAYNVEYTLQVLRCKKRPLTEAELALVAEMKSMDELRPRATAEDQKKFIEEVILGGKDADAPAELGGGASVPGESVDDIPL